IFFFFKFNSRITFYLSILLFQIDEDAFILFSLAFAHKLFNYDQYLLLVSTTALSLLLTPLLIAHKEKIYFATRSFMKKYLPALELFIRHRMDADPTTLDAMNIKNHIIICGYGRVGAHIGKALMNAGIPFVAIDYNFHNVQ